MTSREVFQWELNVCVCDLLPIVVECGSDLHFQSSNNSREAVVGRSLCRPAILVVLSFFVSATATARCCLWIENGS